MSVITLLLYINIPARITTQHVAALLEMDNSLHAYIHKMWLM